MDFERETTKPEISAKLAHRNGALCVLAERRNPEGPDRTTFRLWYPIRDAAEAEVDGLLGRPVTEVDVKEGIYVDEEGTVFQLADKGGTKPILVEETPVNGGELEQLLTASIKNGKTRTHALQRTTGRRKKERKQLDESLAANGTGAQTSDPGSLRQEPVLSSKRDHSLAEESVPLNLRQKLAEVRRRIGYIQKRGFNERNNYSYVTAADLAGAVGDILAELGVVIIPSLESIVYEPGRNAGSEVSRAAQVVMAYTFTDVDTGEAITAKVAGQGLDSGDKAPYKAMTGALKYALLQSFLLATGDDPEEERISHSPAAGSGSDHPVTAEQARELRSLIDETQTELDRVLSYYKVNSLEEMPQSSYRRAVELLNRKRAKQPQGNNEYAQD